MVRHNVHTGGKESGSDKTHNTLSCTATIKHTTVTLKTNPLARIGGHVNRLAHRDVRVWRAVHRRWQSVVANVRHRRDVAHEAVISLD